MARPPSSALRAVALRLLTRREYTTFELRTKLTARQEYADDEIEQTLASLASQGFLDDRRAAAAHVRSASRIKSRGRLRIQRELEIRGLDRELIRRALDDLPAADEAAALERILQRRGLPNRLPAADRRRLFQQLLRRGFTADLIAKALRQRQEGED